MWVVENDFISVWIDVYLFLCCRRRWLGFSVRIAINRLFRSGLRNRLDIRVGIEIDLIQVMGSKLTGFCVRNQNRSGLVWGSNWIALRAGVKIDFALCAGRKFLFSVGIDWLGFRAGDRNWLEFSVGDGTWLDFSVGIKLIRLLCGWSKLISFWCRDQNSLGLCAAVEKDFF